ncbi:hypothetical protein QIS99_12955 [Streptomyces sp. B-S-A8]|uniref:DUF559 domain-containing protein n=1 Tax=Streptomyces solicavernae TaxID=3043614 RepID=A0ABT6RRT3_9ACTN|nr:hypothetical protein [Streptomyces sp. B-S-A8]MDI3387100.1 hypothetical protein [Streptomyces sp. B-S-A8]
MNHNTPVSHRPSPRQELLPGVFLPHPGPPTGEELLHAVLLYARRPPGPGSVPQQAPRPVVGDAAVLPYEEAMITGLAALALHGFASAPPLLSLDRIDALVPRTRRLRSTGCARIVRSAALPRPRQIAGVHVAPVPRALADAAERLTDAGAVRRLLAEAVGGGHCELAAVVRELEQARLLQRPHVVDAVESLRAEGRAVAEDRLFQMVREYGLPDPVWNVDLRLPGGPPLGGVDAYWPDQSVAVELDMRTSPDAGWEEYVRRRELLEQLGITVVHVTPAKLRTALDQQATVVRTALMAAADRDPAAYVVVLPR